jgi:TolB protein
MTRRLALLALLAGVLVAVGGPHDHARAAFGGKNGRIAFVRYTGAAPLEEVYMVSPASGLTANLSGDPATSDTAPAWSPDGTRVALQRSGPVEGIWVLEAATGAVSFVPHSDHGFQPAWSPDGDWIAFSRDAGGDAELWMVRADGSDLVQLTDNADEDREASWSPDGTQIAFTREGPGATTNIMLLALGGGGELAVTRAGVFDGAPDWSPDGARIAFARGGDQDDGLPFHIHTVPLATGRTAQVTSGRVVDLMPSWQPL